MAANLRSSGSSPKSKSVPKNEMYAATNPIPAIIKGGWAGDKPRRQMKRTAAEINAHKISFRYPAL
jgi:hypothetical protein